MRSVSKRWEFASVSETSIYDLKMLDDFLPRKMSILFYFKQNEHFGLEHFDMRNMKIFETCSRFGKTVSQDTKVIKSDLNTNWTLKSQRLKT